MQGCQVSKHSLFICHPLFTVLTEMSFVQAAPFFLNTFCHHVVLGWIYNILLNQVFLCSTDNSVMDFRRTGNVLLLIAIIAKLLPLKVVVGLDFDVFVLSDGRFFVGLLSSPCKSPNNGSIIIFACLSINSTNCWNWGLFLFCSRSPHKRLVSISLLSLDTTHFRLLVHQMVHVGQRINL